MEAAIAISSFFKSYSIVYCSICFWSSVFFGIFRHVIFCFQKCLNRTRHKTLAFLRAISHLHLGTRRNLHTKQWFALSSSMQVLYGMNPYNDTETEKMEKLRRTFLEDGNFLLQDSSGTVSLDKDKYLTLAPRLRYTRASHDSQYTTYMSYSDALKNSFFLRTIPLWNSLPSSVVASKTTEEFKTLIYVKGPEVYISECLCAASCK